MSDVGKVLFGLRGAHNVDEAIEKSVELVTIINAANDTELEELKKSVAHVWQNSVMGLLALRLMPDYSEAARLALGRLTEGSSWRQ